MRRASYVLSLRLLWAHNSIARLDLLQKRHLCLTCAPLSPSFHFCVARDLRVHVVRWYSGPQVQRNMILLPMCFPISNPNCGAGDTLDSWLSLQQNNSCMRRRSHNLERRKILLTCHLADRIHNSKSQTRASPCHPCPDLLQG